MKHFIYLIILFPVLSFILIMVLAICLFYYHFKNIVTKGVYIKKLYQISQKYNISGIEKDLVYFIFFTDIYTNSDFHYFNDKFFDILYTTGIEKDKLENLYTEIDEIFSDIAFDDTVKDFRDFNRYRSNNWNNKVYNMFIPLITLIMYNSNQSDKDQKNEKIFHVLFNVGIIIGSVKKFVSMGKNTSFLVRISI